MNHIASADGREQKPEQPLPPAFAANQRGFTKQMWMSGWAAVPGNMGRSGQEEETLNRKGFNPAQCQICHCTAFAPFIYLGGGCQLLHPLASSFSLLLSASLHRLYSQEQAGRKHWECKWFHLKCDKNRHILRVLSLVYHQDLIF